MPRVPSQRATGTFGERSADVQRHNALHNGRAVRVVAGRAIDADDCRNLLEMLGLDADARSEDRRR